jgi:outer membrane protein assembly factor BamB
LNGQLALVDSTGNWVSTYAFGAGLTAGPLVDADGTAYLAISTGEVYALDAPYFTQSLAVKIIPDGKGPIGSIALTETGLLLVTSLEGKLYAFGP